jgi:hypothetical protein
MMKRGWPDCTHILLWSRKLRRVFGVESGWFTVSCGRRGNRESDAQEGAPFRQELRRWVGGHHRPMAAGEGVDGADIIRAMEMQEFGDLPEAELLVLAQMQDQSLTGKHGRGSSGEQGLEAGRKSGRRVYGYAKWLFVPGRNDSMVFLRVEGKMMVHLSG